MYSKVSMLNNIMKLSKFPFQSRLKEFRRKIKSTRKYIAIESIKYFLTIEPKKLLNGLRKINSSSTVKEIRDK